MLVMPATFKKACQGLSAFNHGRGQAQSPHASACPQEIGRWFGRGGGCQFVFGGKSVAQAKNDLPMEPVFSSKATQTV